MSSVWDVALPESCSNIRGQILNSCGHMRGEECPVLDPTVNESLPRHGSTLVCPRTWQPNPHLVSKILSDGTRWRSGALWSRRSTTALRNRAYTSGYL